MLALEVDGDSHDDKKYLDKQRDLCLEQSGIKTIRFTNEEILNDVEKVKIRLKNLFLK